MSSDSTSGSPRHYFLNEKHQLAPVENEVGGRQTKILIGDVQKHGGALAQSIESIKSERRASPDPTVNSRMFILAQPQSALERTSTSKKAIGGKVPKSVKFSGVDSSLIERMGFNLLGVTEDGSAIVHVNNDRLGQIQQSLRQLEMLGVREQNKWAHIREFVDIPLVHKTSLSWWGDNLPASPIHCTIDLQPFLTRREVDQLAKILSSELRDDERLLGTGTEFSGRVWINALLKARTIVSLSERFQSISSIHPPIYAVPLAREPAAQVVQTLSPSILLSREDARSLPCVAVFDTGIPSDHVLLGQFRRGGFSGEGCSGTVPDGHGSFVASRVVFGDVEAELGTAPASLEARCSVFDVNLSDRGPGGDTAIRTSSLISSIQRLSDAAPDVRVLNFSFDVPHDLNFYQGSYREKLLHEMADVDNKAFSEDLIIVVAAGNSPQLNPSPEYPQHFDLDEWKLRAWSRCFNVLICGGSADKLSPSGVARESGAPSPFTRIGPGFVRSRKPDFSAHAGNANANYQQSSGDGLGVWGCDDLGNWVEWAGTSHAAPLLAREAARTLSYLQTRCVNGSKPFASLVKAVMALRARRRLLSESLTKLANRTLGFGAVKLEDIEPATDDRAAFLWQGIIGSDQEKLIVELPVPGQWVRDASKPTLRLMAAWDTPVNPAVEDVWACRQVSITLRPAANAEALHSSVTGTKGYPLTERKYDLSGEVHSVLSNTDVVLAELSYAILAPYPSGFEAFSPQQRVAIAYELVDAGEAAVSPHSYVQSLPIATTLDRLSTIVPSARQAVTVRLLQ